MRRSLRLKRQNRTKRSAFRAAAGDPVGSLAQGMSLARERAMMCATRVEPTGGGAMKVQDVMTKDPSCVTPSATIREAAQLMEREDIGIVPVVNDKGSNRLVGLITDRDIAIRVVAQGHDGDLRVSDIMSTSDLATCSADDDVSEVMEAMANEQVRRIPIIDDRGTLVGIVAQADIVRKARDTDHAERTVQQISEPTGKHKQ